MPSGVETSPPPTSRENAERTREPSMESHKRFQPARTSEPKTARAATRNEPGPPATTSRIAQTISTTRPRANPRARAGSRNKGGSRSQPGSNLRFARTNSANPQRRRRAGRRLPSVPALPPGAGARPRPGRVGRPRPPVSIGAPVAGPAARLLELPRARRDSHSEQTARKTGRGRRRGRWTRRFRLAQGAGRGPGGRGLPRVARRSTVRRTSDRSSNERLAAAGRQG
jgi:hypothetical protein